MTNARHPTVIRIALGLAALALLAGHVIVLHGVAVDNNSFLALDESEAGSELEQKALALAEQRGPEVLLAVGVLQPQEVEHIRILEVHVRWPTW